MIMMTMKMLAVSQEQDLVHDDKDDVRWLGNAKLFQVLKQ